jgi:hypothetical protein
LGLSLRWFTIWNFLGTVGCWSAAFVWILVEQNRVLFKRVFFNWISGLIRLGFDRLRLTVFDDLLGKATVDQIRHHVQFVAKRSTNPTTSHIKNLIKYSEHAKEVKKKVQNVTRSRKSCQFWKFFFATKNTKTMLISNNTLY